MREILTSKQSYEPPEANVEWRRIPIDYHGNSLQLDAPSVAALMRYWKADSSGKGGQVSEYQWDR